MSFVLGAVQILRRAKNLELPLPPSVTLQILPSRFLVISMTPYVPFMTYGLRMDLTAEYSQIFRLRRTRYVYFDLGVPSQTPMYLLASGGSAPRPADYWSDFYEPKVGHFELSCQLVLALNLVLLSSDSLH